MTAPLMTAACLSTLPDPRPALDAAVAVLARARPVAIPTETVYGLAADATDPQAITAIYETKGRPRFNPLICHMASLDMAKRHAAFDPLSERLARAFWPGPLTLLLPLAPGSAIHPLATAGLPTVGIRVPQGFAGALIAAFGKPLAAPSANTSGRISPTTAADVMEDLGGRIDLVVDGGPAGVGVESTILKVEDGVVRCLRPGGLDLAAVEALIGAPVERTAQHADLEPHAPEAPGMLASHYAPDAPIRLEATTVAPDEALIRFGSGAIAGEASAVAVFDLSRSGDLREAAANLFTLMHEADRVGARAIAVAPVPATGLGEAINDRLMRAAVPRPK